MNTKILLFTNQDSAFALKLKELLEERGFRAVCVTDTEETVDYEGISGIICLPDRIPEIPLLTLTREAADLAYETGYKAMLLRARAAANAMIDAGTKGSIVFITDMDGVRSSKYDFLSGSLHAALHRSSESLALQLAPYGIRVNCLAPGRIDQEGTALSGPNRFPMQRRGTPAEICEAALWLVSEHSSYVTGTVLKCDGGNSLAGMPECEAGYGWDKERA